LFLFSVWCLSLPWFVSFVLVSLTSGRFLHGQIGQVRFVPRRVDFTKQILPRGEESEPTPTHGGLPWLWLLLQLVLSHVVPTKERRPFVVVTVIVVVWIGTMSDDTASRRAMVLFLVIVSGSSTTSSVCHARFDGPNGTGHRRRILPKLVGL
jgi:hypothetical protein